MCFAVSEFVLDTLHDQPFVTLWLGVLYGLIVLLGVIHLTRILAHFLIIAIRHLKHELSALGKTLEYLKKELGSWKLDGKD